MFKVRAVLRTAEKDLLEQIDNTGGGSKNSQAKGSKRKLY